MIEVKGGDRRTGDLGSTRRRFGPGGKVSMGRVIEWVGNVVTDERGASAAEYALYLSIVSTGIADAAIMLGQSISEAVSDAASCISAAKDFTDC